jgi:hypothetical protein
MILDDVALLALGVDLLLLSRPCAVLSLMKEPASASVSVLLQVTSSAVARLNFRLADVVEVEAARRAWEAVAAEAEVANALLLPPAPPDLSADEALALLAPSSAAEVCAGG